VQGLDELKTKEISRSDALTRAETITGTPAPPAEPSTGATDRVLVVDLDGTLLRSDMLHETLWNALTRDPRAGLRALGALRRGRAALKDALAQDTTVRGETLPFDPRVIARIEARRAAGGRIALVTATDQRLAEAVAAHLGLFDEVHGSAEGVNLKGAEKARFLADRYGRGGFDYIGDSSADLPVWEAAERAISVGASAAVRRQLDARAGARPEHLPPAQAPAAAILRALRPHQWLKNVLVFVPMVADLAFDPRSFLMSLLAFVALSFAASAGYVVNDLLDLSDDRSHPRKRNRPFASGAVSAQVGTALIPLLLLGGAMAALAVGPVLLGVVALYFVATLSYSVKLKQHTMVDICMLATLYTIRIIAGGVAIGVVLSVWLLAVSMFMFFSLAAVKRLAELTDLEAAGREVSRRGYRVEDRAVLSQMAIASGYLSVLVLALYIDEPLVQEKFGAPWLLWGVCPLLIFWISRMVMIAARGEMHDDPMIWALENRTSRKVMLGTAIFIALAVVA
jgi:4-hydroxybenzoate polyprenyltransferase/phosphoserine phosphatase